MDCKELDQPVLLTFILREKDEREINRIFGCFYKHYYEPFMYILFKLSRKYPFLKDDPEFYVSQAFADGLLTFSEKISVTGFKEGDATLKTFFLSFCINKLRALITTRRRDNDKFLRLVRDTKNDPQGVIAEKDLLSENEALFLKALGMLEEKKRQYIILRKIDGCTNEEIAAKMGIAPGSVNSEVFKAFLKLKETINSLKGKK